MSVLTAPHASAAIHPVCEDRRIQELEGLIDSGDFDLLSLDVFDTLVWRMVPQAADVFFLVGHALRERGLLFESSTIESFARERLHAEHRARKRVPSLEVTLAEIYAEFPCGYLRGVAPADVAELELEIESAIVRPDEAMLTLIERARARGIRVALVSDTYFTADQLRALTGIDTDFVLASCEHRLSKYRGLHRVLIEQSGVAAARVLHVGDNFASDIEGPSEVEIARYWYRRFPHAYSGLLATELPGAYSARVDYVARPEHGISSLRARAMFSCATEHERWGAGVLGPIIAGFGDWVAGRCEELGVRTALCLMREGRILRQVLDTQESGLDAREVFVSRIAALKAAILDGTEAELRRFMSRPSPPLAQVLLGQLGLKVSDLGANDPDARLEPSDITALSRRIARDPRLRAKVVKSSAEARTRLLRHFDHAGALSGTVAVVDLGYSGTIQECLERIFERERPGLHTHGLYLVTGGSAHRAQATGCAVEGWIAENDQPIAMAHTFMRSPEIVEQSLMADCGTTLGHEADGTPVLDTPHVPDDQRRQIAEVQTGLLRYAKLWAAHRALHGAPDPLTARRLAQAITIRAIARPLDIELDLFAEWQHDENFGSESTRTLAEVVDQHPWEASHLSAHQLASLPHARVYWPFGYAAGLGQTMRDAVAGIFMRAADPQVFDSALRPRPVGFFWDAGLGFNTVQNTVQECAAGNRGRAWQRFTLDLEQGSLRTLAFALGAPGEIVRITGVRVHVRPTEGAAETHTFAHDVLETSGYEHLDGSLYRVTEEPALIVVPLEGLSAFTGRVDADLFFSVFTEE